MVGTKNTGGKQVEEVVITIPFPSCVASVSLETAFGTATYDDMSKVSFSLSLSLSLSLSVCVCVVYNYDCCIYLLDIG
jgi:hypothetical protein